MPDRDDADDRAGAEADRGDRDTEPIERTVGGAESLRTATDLDEEGRALVNAAPEAQQAAEQADLATPTSPLRSQPPAEKAKSPSSARQYEPSSKA
jgi:hypothetical protein